MSLLIEQIYSLDPFFFKKFPDGDTSI